MSLRGGKVSKDIPLHSNRQGCVKSCGRRSGSLRAVSQRVGSRPASRDVLPEYASDLTSSVKSLTPNRGVSPSFQRSLMDLQEKLQQTSARHEEEEAQYIRMLESCIGENSVHECPFSRSNACSEVVKSTYPWPTLGNTNVILLKNQRNNVRLEVALHRLRGGITGQQPLIRLHHADTHLELEYSDAVEDLELSYSPIATNKITHNPGTIGCCGKNAVYNSWHPIRGTSDLFELSEFKIPWILATTGLVSLTAALLYYKNRNTSLI